ncbi:hypothetical protein O6H91_16G095000 [Diphasiastrum complanatum]|uniref:Uncharacterized protein n=1 Tax=Diphasiastrum complanatum TaxID=34168 RepID=A0ACC2BF57_DIPCM|nr:hypothetical protein O6H91_16G095000 [Diphasiastrum complanatum]
MDFSLGSMGVSLGLSGGNIGFGDRTLANLTSEMAENRARILAQGGAGLLLPSTGMLKQTRSISEVEMEMESREEALAPLKLARPYQQDPYLYRPSGIHMSMAREGLSFYDAAATGGRYPFTAAQWAELEHQALIYKYIIHGYPVPDDLLVPIRKSVAALSGLPYGMSGVGWGSFSVGAGSSVDAEPGRCRRTDGKKWRCSRPVVPEQKYCERHMHRGRHRSRKAAEAQANSLSQQPPTTTPPPPPAAAPTQHPSLLTQSAHSISLKPTMVVNSASQQQISAASLATKTFLNRPSSPTTIATNPSCSSAALPTNHFQLPPQSPSASMAASKDPRFVNGLGNLRPEHLLASEMYGSSSRMLLEQKPSLPWPANAQLSKLPPLLHQKSSSNSVYLYDSPLMIMQEASPLSPFIDHQQQQQQQLGYFHSRHPSMEAADVKSENQPLRHFFDDWPRSRDSSTLSWSDAEEEKQPQPKSSATQLSISITAASDLTSSPARSKTVFSPLRLSMSRAGTEDAAADPTHMGLGMALTSHQSLWFPMSSMENPMGGPLAEALQSSGPHAVNKAGGGAGGLNLLGDGGRNDSSASPQESSRLPSPTGVLQKTFGCCFSDSSSSASSPASGKPEAVACDQNLKAHLTNGSTHVAT